MTTTMPAVSTEIDMPGSPPQTSTPNQSASAQLDRKIQNPFLTTSDVIGHLNKALEQVNQEQAKLVEKEHELLQNQEIESDGDDNDEDDDNESDNDAPPKKPLNLQNQQAHFELQRRLPDGSTRRATASEQKAADLESKLQQVATQICLLPHSQQWAWLTKQQRPYGNELYASQQYAQAIDVYLTCVMVLQNLHAKQADFLKRRESQTPSILTEEERKDFDFVLNPLEHDIFFVQLMNNLAQSALQLAWYKKAIQFCDLCLEQQEQAQQEQQSMPNISQSDPTFLFQMSKLHFKRAKAHRLRGQYPAAKEDLRKSSAFVHQSQYASSSTENADTVSASLLAKQLSTASKEIAKETRLIQQSIQEARKNEQRQQKAMQHILGNATRNDEASTDVNSFEALDNDDFGSELDTDLSATNTAKPNSTSSPSVAPLYDENTTSRTRTHSSLRSRTKSVMVDKYPHDSLSNNEAKSGKAQDLNSVRVSTRPVRLTYWQYYWAVVGRVAEHLLIWLGDEETIEKYKRLERE